MKKLLLFLTFAFVCTLQLFAQVPTSERNALFSIYIESQGNLWLDNTNWNTTDPVSTWYGVTTAITAGVEHVTEIDLSSNNLNGTLPVSISDLPFLANLKMNNNLIEDTINLSALTMLTTVQLNNNEISGLQLPNNISISSGNFNIKNNPNLGCVQVPSTAVFNSLSLEYIDLGTIITTDCSSVNNLPQTEKDALDDLYTDTNGSSWSNSTYLITDPTLNAGNKGFTYIDIAGVRHLKTLDLSQNYLNGIITATFGSFSQLTDLRLNNNSINGLPEELSNLTNLQILYLNNNNSITTLPTNFGNLSSLTELYIQNCNFNVIPASIYNLTSLTKFNFRNNDVTLLPPEIGNLTNLTELIASPNPFPSVPAEMGNLVNLTVLDLSGSLITNIPAGFGNLVNLTELYLNNNNLQVIFENGMGNLTQLTKLTLANNSLTELPNDIGNLTLLTELTLRQNQFTSLPDGIGNLTLLTELNLYNSNLTALPASIGNLTALTSLNLYGNELSGLPTTIGNLVNLTFLNLYNNQLTSLPTELGNLVNLETLNISYQYDSTTSNRTLTTVPSAISNLTALTSLNLNTNAITSSINLAGLTNLSEINLGANKITGLTLGVAPIASNNFYLADNPFLTCIQVPTAHVAGWNSLIGGIYLDNGVIFSDNCATGDYIPQAEREALIDIYNTLANNNNWTNWSTDINESPLSNTGSWRGITTAQVNGSKHVVEINLSGFFGTTNALPSSIENFTELTKLYMDANSYSNRANINTLPTTIGNLSNLTNLHLGYNNLTSLPDEIGNLQNLERLTLYRGDITALPATIGNLSSLENFNIAYNKLTTLPASIGNLTNLEVFDLRSNEISSLPTEIGNLPSLLTLNLSSQRDVSGTTYTLTTIPTEINNITTLTSLNLSYNALTGNLDFSNLLSLNNIQLTSNEITGVKFGVPPTNFCTNSSSCFSLTSNPNLSCIEVPTAHLAAWQSSSLNSASFIDNGVVFSDNCANNNIPQLEREALIAIYNALASGTGWSNWNTDPNSLSNVGSWLGVTTDFINGVKHVTKLTIGGSGINITNNNALPTEIGNLPELLELTISGSTYYNRSITSLPAEIGNLVNLTDFYLYTHPQLTSLPNEIGDLTSLEDLNITSCPIQSLPTTIGNLTNLTYFSVDNCGLTSLPATIGNLSNLSTFRASGNSLTTLPDEFGNLASLEILNISSNNISSLPTTIGNLSALRSLEVSGNQLTTLPSEFNTITSLESILINNNQLTGAINLDGLTNLTNLKMQDNTFSSIKLGIGPVYYTSLRLNSNPYLTCVEVPTQYLTAWENSGVIGNGYSTDNGVIVSDACSITNVPNSERLALIAIHNALAGTNTWTNWNTDPNDLSNVGSWDGVMTSIVNGQKHVIFLNTPYLGNASNNPLPTEIGDLPELLELDISGTSNPNNSITGLPNSIGNLSKLIILRLYNNQLLTSLPTTIGQLDALETLNLSGSGLTSLPAEIGNFNSIKTIDLYNNQLTQIPSEIGNNNTLEILDLNYNQLTTLPANIGNLQSLERLYVRDNNLTSIPTEINDIVTLEALYLTNNQIEGALNLSNLTVLNQLLIYNNSITSLKLNLSPTAFGNTTNQMNYNFQVTNNDFGCIEVPTAEVVSWELSGANVDAGVVFSDDCSQENPTPQVERDALIAFYNATNGANWTNATNWLSSEPVSSWYGITVTGFNKVKKIELVNNNLTGILPSDLEDLPELEVLTLVSNTIGGNLPIELGNLLNLKTLNLLTNNFTGNIPVEIGNITTLESLVLGANNFSGTIPLELGSLSGLKNLFLQGNSFSGSIPIELGSLYNLEVLYLNGNDLDGAIPTSLGNLNNVYSMRLNGNNLTGTIPSNIISNSLQYFSVSNNNLSGNIPVFYGTSLIELSINNNLFTSLNVSNLPSLTSLNCSNNQLENLNINNGNNSNLTLLSLNNNSNLTCVQVDNQIIADDWNLDANLPITFAKDVHTAFSTNCSEVIIGAKTYLQGASKNPFIGEETLMRDDLRINGYLPTTSPYTDVATTDTSVFGITGSNAIVDWVWVELRDKNDNTAIIASKSALLQRDGDIVDVDGVSSIGFNVPSSFYYVAISHRNHLGIVSSYPIALSSSTLPIDFSSSSTSVNGGTNAVIDLGNGIFGIFAGDYDGNGQIQNTDSSTVVNQLGNSGYSHSDIDLNGQTQNTDINILINQNIGRGQQFARQQLKLFAKRKN